MARLFCYPKIVHKLSAPRNKHFNVFLLLEPEGILIFSNKYDVRQLSVSGGDYRSIIETRSSSAIAVDVKDDMIYWTDILNKTISRTLRDSRMNTKSLSSFPMSKLSLTSHYIQQLLKEPSPSDSNFATFTQIFVKIHANPFFGKILANSFFGKPGKFSENRGNLH